MSNEIKPVTRFTCGNGGAAFCQGCYEMSEDEDGHYVEFSAYEELANLVRELEKPLKPKMAPVQGYVQGIPWDMHLEAYNAYCKRYGAQQALIEGGCRGGFGVGELDMFIPGWREKLSLVGKLNAEIESLHKKIKSQMNFGEPVIVDLSDGNVIGEDTGRVVAKFSHWNEAQSFCEAANFKYSMTNKG